MKGQRVLRLTAAGGALAAATVLARRWQLGWGATARERDEPLPGDDLLAGPGLTVTRAITIGAPAGQVWPWIAQLGQGRGGFYSYDFLENLAGCDIHSADAIVPAWQDIGVGDPVRLAPQVPLAVAALDRGARAGAARRCPTGRSTALRLHLGFRTRDQPDRTTRLIVRERYTCTRSWARLLVEAVEPVAFVMTQKMLRGIKNRAEHPTPPGGAPAPGKSRAGTDERHRPRHHQQR